MGKPRVSQIKQTSMSSFTGDRSLRHSDNHQGGRQWNFKNQHRSSNYSWVNPKQSSISAREGPGATKISQNNARLNHMTFQGKTGNNTGASSHKQSVRHDAILVNDLEVDGRVEDTTLASNDQRVNIRCLRCTQQGHVVANCQAVLYCVICDSNDHVNHECPILKQPRTVAHAAGCAVQGLGFYHIPHPPLPKEKKDNMMALISVLGGTLTKEQIITQLQMLIPSRWDWELKEQEQGFVAQFPSKVELQRAIAFGGADVKMVGVSVGIRLQFAKWSEKEEGYLLPKVWVRVYGLRKKLREFINLWAVGSLLGSTQTVDMEMTRKNNFGRICIAVLNPKLIPSQLKVVIGDHYFELRFEIENIGMNDSGDEIELDLFKSDDENDKEQEEDSPMDELNPKDSKEPKRHENNTSLMPDKDGADHEQTKESKDAFLADHVPLESETLISFSEEVSTTLPDIVQEAVNNGNGSLKISEVAAIPESTISSAHASSGPAGTAIEHVLVRAECQTARKNLDFDKGNNISHCLFLKPVEDAISNIKQLGVYFGDSYKDQTEAVNQLYLLDRSRTSVTSGLGLEREDENIIESDNESLDDSLFPNTLNHLCGDITKEVFDGDDCHLKYNFKAIYKKNKRSNTCKLFSKQNKCKVRIVQKNKESLQ